LAQKSGLRALFFFGFVRFVVHDLQGIADVCAAIYVSSKIYWMSGIGAQDNHAKPS
jgi:hypothetical protein